jgi:hypothetical protein
MKDSLNFVCLEDNLDLFRQTEDDLNFILKGRHVSVKWKKISISASLNLTRGWNKLSSSLFETNLEF